MNVNFFMTVICIYMITAPSHADPRPPQQHAARATAAPHGAVVITRDPDDFLGLDGLVSVVAA
jgi:predicted nucleic acid-binding protein